MFLIVETLTSQYTNQCAQSKDQAADDIKAQYPDLAKKTTFLWVGFFTSNLWSYPMMKPIEIVSLTTQTIRIKIPQSQNEEKEFPKLTLSDPAR